MAAMSRKWIDRYPLAPASRRRVTGADAALVGSASAVIGAALTLAPLAPGVHLSIAATTRLMVVAVAMITGAGLAVLHHAQRPAPVPVRNGKF
jgi:VIT1/CCC1 family predicted Fe2+/Mn2+ transporter